jgi:hypothetical protein
VASDEASAAARVHAGGMAWFQYARWTLWGWIVRVMLTLLVIGTAIELLGALAGL